MKKKLSKKAGNARRGISRTATPPSILKILATTDFSDESRCGMRYAVALAEKFGAAVTLLHVVEPPSPMAGMEAVGIVRDESEVVALARAQLATSAKRESQGDVAVTVSVRTGKPFHEIATAARQQMADLIVIATHGYTGFEHVLLGSTAERVVRHAPCSVLTLSTRTSPKRTGKSPAFTLKKILVPIDFSNPSKVALPQAVLLATHFGAELVLLHTVETFSIDYLLGSDLMNQVVVPLMKQAEADLEQMAEGVRRSTGLDVSAVVGEGKPFEVICQTAKTLRADMIVLTTHGYTGLKHVWLGSTAERVVRHAPCPVLVVRAREHGFIESRSTRRGKSLAQPILPA